MPNRDTADLVIVGAGTIGGWASVFAREHGAERVVVLERGEAGQGASSRAAGIVRAQGGTRETVQLGMWSIAFYRSQHERYGTDSGFRELGYLILATDEHQEADAIARVEMQRAAGLTDVRWVDAAEAARLNPTLDPTTFRGGTFAPGDGCVDPPRNVRAYSLAMQRAGVQLRERTPFLGIERSSTGDVLGVRTPDGTIATGRVLLTGGPTLRQVGALVDSRFFVGAVRHQVAVTEPHEAFDVERQPMVFENAIGLYWRLEEGGLLFGMSNPGEAPGLAREVDWPYLHEMEERVHRYVPVAKDLGIRKAWAATIEYCPDHLPVVGPVRDRTGDVIDGMTVATAVGHGMMWGPGVARIGTDLALTGATDVTDASGWTMDRFDEEGRSPSYDPIALPFPVSAEEDPIR
ncbi:MAG TPA: FAD-binding oxidoreductase [Actinomycetota bacterium]|nr:FAD-binding oxidoreductase [Actinomycetota bacterium]